MLQRGALVTMLISLGLVPVAKAVDPPVLTQITHSETPDPHAVLFSMSDDAQWLVWGRAEASYSTTWRLFTSDSQGGHLVELRTIHTYAPGIDDCDGVSMSGDGHLVAFASTDDFLGANPNHICQIYVIDRDGSNLRQLTTQLWGTSTAPALNYDGSVLVCAATPYSFLGVVKIQVSNGVQRNLDQPPANGRSRFDPSIDSAGEHVAYQAFEVSYFGARGVMSNGTSLHDLTPFSTNGTSRPGISVSGDGSTVLYRSAGNYTNENPNGTDPYEPAIQAFVIPWAGGTIRQISDGATVLDAFASTKPMTYDGARAAFQIWYYGNQECSMTWIDTATRATEDIVPRSAEGCLYWTPLVSANGRILAFSSMRVSEENPEGHAQVFVLRYPEPQSGSAPVASAGQDQRLECEGARRATAVLDGSASSDADSTPGTNDDIVTYLWTEGGTTLIDGAHGSIELPLGHHDIALTVTDHAGLSAQDRTNIDVVDSVAPAGTILAPAEASCFGPASVAVTLVDDFADACDADIARSYEPGPGPTYQDHGDHHVTLSVADTSGNVGTAGVGFVIDTVPPDVTVFATNAIGSAAPPVIRFEANDDDGASGPVLVEIVKLQGCTIYDGRTYGNRDGLLSDETLVLTNDELCRIAATCGFATLERPTLRVEATDCGGNVGAAFQDLSGSVSLLPGICGGNLKGSALKPSPRKRRKS